MSESQKEYASTYPVQDRSNQEEMIRLDIQDKMLTMGMGGVLPELSDPTVLRRVLDVGCGTGGWLMEAARTYPTIERLVGVDISNKMMAYARAKAKDEGLDGRVEFLTMDALRILEFPASSFDLINQRAGISWLRTWEWTKLLSEYQRVCRTDGIIRITEGTIVVESNSPALTKLSEISLEAMHHSGRLWTLNSGGVGHELASLMTTHGIKDVESRTHTLVHRAGTQAGQYFYDDVAMTFRIGLPFLQKWARIPSDYEEIYQQTLKEMRQPDFFATVTFLTAWGKSPAKKERSPQIV
jgi:ubiquinone/menaquinone biosynthesis C-methylase UbiE